MTEQELIELGNMVAELCDKIRAKTGAKSYVRLSNDGTGGTFIVCHDMPKSEGASYVGTSPPRFVNYVAYKREAKKADGTKTL
jgi:hypothetical protein